jgi:hypothetical protein
MIKFDILKSNDKFEIENLGVVTLYDTDNLNPLSGFIKNTNSTEFFKMSFDSNNVYNSSQGVYLFNTIDKNNKRKVKIGEDNFGDAMVGFTARKLIPFTWINEYSEYLQPNIENEDYTKFKNNSVVYSLFNSQNLLQPKNEFFWMSKNEMAELSNRNNYTELYNDARTDSDRYVHTLLFGEEGIHNQLSDEAKDVLDSATNLVRLSFGMRRNFADTTNHLNSWDAGYAQLKLLWKEYYPEQFKEFRVKYKVLEDKMRPMVYELGFLLK